jgi:hypothetical protein
MQNVLAPRLPSKSKVGTLLICRASKLSCSVPTAMRAGGSLRGRLWRAGARHSAPLKSASFRSFLADTRKELNHRTNSLHKIFSTGLVECGKISCEKLLEKSAEKISTQAVWKNSEYPQFVCGEKIVAALSKMSLFHISSYYYLLLLPKDL